MLVTYTGIARGRLAAWAIVAAPVSVDESSVVHSGEEAYQTFSDDAAGKYIASRSDSCIG